MISAIIEALDREGTTLGLAPVRSAAVLGLDRDPTAKVTLILFGSDRRPVAFAKTTRGEREAVLLEQEHAALLRLAGSPLPRTSAQIPQPLLFGRIRGHLVLVTSAVPGAPLLVRYHTPGHTRTPRRVGADFGAAGRWLARFQRDSAQGWLDCNEAFLAQSGAVLARYRAAHGWGPQEHSFMNGLEALAASLRGVRVPVSAVHGDYCLGNILVSGSAVTGVVDWELGQDVGLPFTDLFKFTTSYASYLDRALPPADGGLAGHPGWSAARDTWAGPGAWPNLVGFLYAFNGSGWFPRIVHDYLADGYDRLGVPDRVQDLFLPLFVAQQATTLTDPVYRNGYRDLFRILAGRPGGITGEHRIAL